MLIITFIIAVLAFILAIAQTIRNDKFTEIKKENEQYETWFKEWNTIIAHIQQQQEKDWNEFVSYTRIVKPLLDKNSIKYDAILTQLNDLQHITYDKEVTDDNSINTKESAQINKE